MFMDRSSCGVYHAHVQQLATRYLIGMGIAKQLAQLHALDPQGGQVARFKLKRARILRETCSIDCRDGSIWKRPRLGGRIAIPWA
jgi:hypothetical protein